MLIRDDGEAVALGSNDHGQCMIESTPEDPFSQYFRLARLALGLLRKWAPRWFAPGRLYVPGGVREWFSVLPTPATHSI